MNLSQKHNEAEILLKEVKVMRTLQKSYFKSRYDDPTNSVNILNQSKLQEKKVDKMIEDYFRPTYPTLF